LKRKLQGALATVLRFTVTLLINGVVILLMSHGLNGFLGRAALSASDPA
jgi:hypothetical protein